MSNSQYLELSLLKAELRSRRLFDHLLAFVAIPVEEVSVIHVHNQLGIAITIERRSRSYIKVLVTKEDPQKPNQGKTHHQHPHIGS